MQSEHLNYLVEVVKMGSLNRAAANLNVAQSTLSRSLDRMERQFGVTLLTRTTGGVALTKEGRAFIVYFKEILKELEEIQQQATIMRPQKSFHLRIANDLCFCIGPLISTFYKQLPMEDVTISLNEMCAEQVIKEVIEHTVDIGLITLTKQQEEVWGDLLEANNIIFHKLAKTTIYVYVGRENPLYDRDEITPMDLKPYSMIYHLEKPKCSFEYHMEGKFGYFFTREKVLYLEDKKLVYEMVAQTDAYTIGPWCDFEPDQYVKLIPIKAEGFYYTIGWLQRKGTEQVEAYTQFLECFTEHIQKQFIEGVTRCN